MTQVLPGKPAGAVKEGTVLEVRNLHVQFHVHGGTVKAVRGLNLTIPAGTTVGLVGESGCGKSVSALTIMRLLEQNAKVTRGEVKFRGKNLLGLSEPAMQQVRGNDISMIYQEPMTALNPVFSVGDQIAESIQTHELAGAADAHKRAVELLRMVGIADAKRLATEYPHELSGGMRQRVMIAMALACDPDLLIADEPTTALDVTIQLQYLKLLKRLQAETGMAILFITHDFGVVGRMCDRVAVMYAGRIVECGPVRQIFEAPQHPYTRALIASVPKMTGPVGRLTTIEGQPPSLMDLPVGCRFASRCALVEQRCLDAYPGTVRVGPEHTADCWKVRPA